MADQAAKAASMRPPEYIPVFYRDWYPLLLAKINNQWNQRWSDKRQKLYTIKERAGPWQITPWINRRQEVVINRLRCGHTKFTHEYLMENDVRDAPPICVFCNNAILIERYLFVASQVLKAIRQRVLTRYVGMNDSVDVATIFGGNIDVASVFKFLDITYR